MHCLQDSQRLEIGESVFMSIHVTSWFNANERCREVDFCDGKVMGSVCIREDEMLADQYGGSAFVERKILLAVSEKRQEFDNFFNEFLGD